MVDLCNERGGGDKRNWVLVIRGMTILYTYNLFLRHTIDASSCFAFV